RVHPENKAPSIGHPIRNTQCYILDRNLTPTPIGIVGLLFIGGAGLARCYLQRPELTADKFIPNPFSQGPGERLYSTGDLARYLADGNLEFLGRRDQQVKLRGFRIELAEIEVALAQHPLVRQVAVLLRQDSAGEPRLIAYLALHEGAARGVSQWRQYLKERLPEYMAPAAYVVLERLPLTANGKLDRKGLPEPERAISHGAETRLRTPVEEIVSVIWEQALGLQRVGVEDNFFDLGG